MQLSYPVKILTENFFKVFTHAYFDKLLYVLMLSIQIVMPTQYCHLVTKVRNYVILAAYSK